MLNKTRDIWPTCDNPSNSVQSSRTSLSSSRVKGKEKSLDQAVERLIRRITRGGDLDVSNLEQSLLNPEFRERLLRCLRKTSFALHQANFSVEILQLAYAEHSHLNWVPYGNLTYKSITNALQSDQLRNATALSLCIDHISGSVNTLFEVLVHCESIHEINFLQKPTRENDDPCLEAFAQLCASSSGSILLRDRKIFLTGAYSAPLQRKPWYPDIESRRIDRALKYTPPVHAFPVQHMFVSQQFVETEDPKLFRPCYFFLGDALLDPERFAVGFLEYCCSVLTDNHLFSFSCCSPKLSTYRVRQRSPGLRISPIAAENFAVQRRFEVPSTNSEKNPEDQFECWPLVRDFEPGGWTVLVFHEWPGGPEDRRKLHPLTQSPGPETEIPYIRYVFFRTRRQIEINEQTTRSSTFVEEITGPDYIEVVGGLTEFLQETANFNNSALVEELLEDRIKTLKGRWPTELQSGMSYLSVLDESDARTVLGEFIRNAAVERENLRGAMEARPEGISPVTQSHTQLTQSLPIHFIENKWYPELLSDDNARSNEPPV